MVTFPEKSLRFIRMKEKEKYLLRKVLTRRSKFPCELFLYRINTLWFNSQQVNNQPKIVLFVLCLRCAFSAEHRALQSLSYNNTSS